VLEAGSANVNGGVRAALQRWEPAEYVGIDIAPGKNVDLVCSIEDIPEQFGANSFDVVISTEVLEHIRDWKTAVRNLKYVLKPGGQLLLTTRSYGMRYHGYPQDFWRFEDEDFQRIFADMDILALEKDTDLPGIMISARKVTGATEVALDDILIYSIVSGAKRASVLDSDLRGRHFRRLLRRERLCSYLERLYYRVLNVVRIY